jgi:hypothetical protein
VVAVELELEEDVEELELSPPPHPASMKVTDPQTHKAKIEVSDDDFMDDDPYWHGGAGIDPPLGFRS